MITFGILRRIFVFCKELRADVMRYYLLVVVQIALLAASWSNLLTVVQTD